MVLMEDDYHFIKGLYLVVLNWGMGTATIFLDLREVIVWWDEVIVAVVLRILVEESRSTSHLKILLFTI